MQIMTKIRRKLGNVTGGCRLTHDCLSVRAETLPTTGRAYYRFWENVQSNLRFFFFTVNYLQTNSKK